MLAAALAIALAASETEVASNLPFSSRSGDTLAVEGIVLLEETPPVPPPPPPRISLDPIHALSLPRRGEGTASRLARDGRFLVEDAFFRFRISPEPRGDTAWRVAPSLLGVWGVGPAVQSTLGTLERVAARRHLRVSDTLVEAADGVRVAGVVAGDRRIDFDDPWLLWPNSVAEGDTWGASILLDLEDGPEPGEVYFVAEGFETVTIPAGRFPTARVRFLFHELSGKRAFARGWMWIAPGVGPVKTSFELGQSDRVRFRAAWTMTDLD